MLGVLSWLRNPDTFSDKPREVATPIAENRRGHPPPTGPSPTESPPTVNGNS